MSLDVYLINDKSEKITSGSGIFIRENGQTKEISQKEWDEKFPGKEPVICYPDDNLGQVFHANITHNLGLMADKVGIYKPLWRAEENSFIYAHQLIEPLEKGLATLKDNPKKFKIYTPSNGWGSYEGLVYFVEDYLDACKEYPNAKIETSK